MNLLDTRVVTTFIMIVSCGLNVVLFTSLTNLKSTTQKAIDLGNEAIQLFNDYQHNIVESCKDPLGTVIHIKLDDGRDVMINCKPEL